MSIADHARKHGIIHLLWIIFILMLVIAYLIIQVRNGLVVRDYIGFASSVASLILAVVAIFYSMISTQGLSEITGTLRSATEESQAIAGVLDITSRQFSERTEDILRHVSNVQPAIREMSDKLEARLASSITEISANQSSGDMFPGEISNGLILSFYLLVKSSQSNKSFDIEKIFEDHLYFAHYCTGAISTIRALSPGKIRIINVEPSNERSVGRFLIVKDLGGVDKDDIIAMANSIDDEESVAVKGIIDKLYDL